MFKKAVVTRQGHGKYHVEVAAGIFFIYRGEFKCWFAKRLNDGGLCDSAPTKAELIRSLEAT
jgi:hypothetical protein